MAEYFKAPKPAWPVEIIGAKWARKRLQAWTVKRKEQLINILALYVPQETHLKMSTLGWEINNQPWIKSDNKLFVCVGKKGSNGLQASC